MSMQDGEYEAMYRLENSYWWFVARRVLAEELLSTEINGRQSVRILDVGCGTGANLTAFARHGTTIGIDSSIDALSFCQTRGIQRLVLSPVEKLPFDDRTFHVVTALDVLEHTDDDLRALAEIQRVCHKDGLLLITVPAAWMTSCLIGLLSLERRVFRRINLPFGVSIVALARPNL